ncbi:MAG: CoA transferase [Chloroflexota bacterium]
MPEKGKAMPPQALAGVKVADFTWAVAGAMVTKCLADYGATVVRIESRKHPDFLRTSGPYKDGKPGPNRTGYFGFFNPNKHSIVIEMDHPGSRDVLRRIISWADVVAENFTPGVMEKHGLDYTHLKEINPGIIMLSTSGQGQTGPFSRVSIGGNWLVGLTGFGWFTGWPDGEVTQPFGAYNDLITPRFGVLGVVAALRYRERTGRGQYIDLSQLEAGAQFLMPPLLDYTVNGHEGGRTGNTSPYAAPHGVYPCLDERWCALAVCSDAEWQAFCRVIGKPELGKDPRFATLPDRKHSEDVLNQMVSEWTVKLSPDEVMRRLQAEDIAAGVVENARDLVEDPQLAHRNYFWKMPHPEMGDFAHMGEAATLSRTPPQPRMPSPGMGEHTEYVCKKILGMSDEEYLAGLCGGVFGDHD